MMIRTYYQTMDDSSRLLVTVRAVICNGEVIKTSTHASTASAERWIRHQYKELFLRTVVRYLHQRRQASLHFKEPQLEFLEAIDFLRARFEMGQSLSYEQVITRIHNSDHALLRIMPAEKSLQAGWRNTIKSLVTQCHDLHNAIHQHERQRAEPSSGLIRWARSICQF